MIPQRNLQRGRRAESNPVSSGPRNKRKWFSWSCVPSNPCCPFSSVSGCKKHESRQLPSQAFASANQFCSSSFCFPSSRRVAKQISSLFLQDGGSASSYLNSVGFFFFFPSSELLCLNYLAQKAVLG